MRHEHEGIFAEGQAREQHHPEGEPHGDFARGQDRRGGRHEGSFAEGQERSQPHREHEAHGNFAKGQEREGS